MVEINGVLYATLQPCSEPGGRTVEAIARRLILGDNARQLREELTEALAGAECPTLEVERLLRHASAIRAQLRAVVSCSRGYVVVQRDLDGAIVAASTPRVNPPSKVHAEVCSARELHVRDVATLRQWGLR